MYDFDGKEVLVTGASQGIGLAIARAFAQAGATLSILAENDAIHAAADMIRTATGATVRAIQCDIADHDAIRNALRGPDRLDVLINNAGYQPMTPIRDPDDAVDDAFRRVIDVNVLGTYYVTREALKRMGRGGRIIMTSSIWGKTGVAGYSGYCASKHAVMGFMRALAYELGPEGITVNAVCPGWVNTEGAMWTVRDEARASGKTVNRLIDEFLAGQPITGLMEPEAVAPMYLFLASASAGDITGQAFNVDRGSFIG